MHVRLHYALRAKHRESLFECLPSLRLCKPCHNKYQASYVISLKWLCATTIIPRFLYVHDDVIKMKHFPCHWPFVRGVHRSSVNFPHKGQWRRALIFSLICVWISGWVNNHEAGDLRHYRVHYDVSVMWWFVCWFQNKLKLQTLKWLQQIMFHKHVNLHLFTWMVYTARWNNNACILLRQ